MNEVPERRGLACRALGVPVTASPQEIRSAFLRSLVDQDFVPQPEAVEALAVLGQVKLSSDNSPNLDRRFERELARSIEELAENYWELSVADRTERWLKLGTAVTDFPRLMSRLEELQAGLTLEKPQSMDELTDFASFEKAIYEIYPKKPRDRADARWKVIESLNGNEQDVVEQTLIEFPELEKIDHGWISKLVSSSDSSGPKIDYSAVQRPEKQTVPTSKNSWQGGWLFMAMCVMCGGGITRFIDRESRDSRSSTPKSTRPSYTLPSNPPQSKQFKFSFHRKQVRILNQLFENQFLNDQTLLALSNQFLVAESLKAEEEWMSPEFRNLTDVDKYLEEHPRLTERQQTLVWRLSEKNRSMKEVFEELKTYMSEANKIAP